MCVMDIKSLVAEQLSQQPGFQRTRLAGWAVLHGSPQRNIYQSLHLPEGHMLIFVYSIAELLDVILHFLGSKNKVKHKVTCSWSSAELESRVSPC